MTSLIVYLVGFAFTAYQMRRVEILGPIEFLVAALLVIVWPAFWFALGIVKTYDTLNRRKQ